MREKGRDYLFDNTKLLLIFLVAAVHLCAAVRGEAGNIYGVDLLMLIACSFHMPLFMFISGYFSKNIEKQRLKAADIFAAYILIQLMFAVYYLVVRNKGITFLSFIAPAFSMWYLLDLGIIKFMLPDLVKMKHLMAISIFISLFAMTSNPDGSFEKAMVKLAANMVYFVLGYFAKAEHIEKIRQANKLVYVLLLVVGIGSFLILDKTGIFSLNYLRMLMLRNTSVLELGFGAIGIFWYAYVIVIALIMGISILGIMPNRKCFLTTFGKNTMTIYIAQAFFYLILAELLSEGICFDGPAANYALALALSAICVVLFGNNCVAGFFHKLMEGCKSAIQIKS